MLPVVTPEQMRAIDAALLWDLGSQDVFIERAGAAVARAALRMLGGGYGRTVNVIAGSGNNGADGRVAARRLDAAGVRVRVYAADDCPLRLPAADLVIDAGYGTGFRGSWQPPRIGDTRVLAVDIPSGVDGLTGAAGRHVLAADRTVTFAALKPGLLFPPGADLAGELELVDIGIGASSATTWLVQRGDVAGWWPQRDRADHKWDAAVRVIAGSPAMTGAAALAVHGAQRAGAGMVHVSTPGLGAPTPSMPVEAVVRPLPAAGWGEGALRTLDRFHAVVLGPGLGRNDDTAASARFVAVSAPLPIVLDGDALFALAWNAEGAAALVRRREAPTVLTPHDGEFQLLTGARPGADRIAACRSLAASMGAVVLLKGPATVIAAPDGRAYVVTSGDARLATAGTGDVLAGMIGALLAHRVPAFEAAAAAAWVHGQAARHGTPAGFVASDLPHLIPTVVASL